MHRLCTQMGFSLQLDFLRAILFRIHKLSKKRRNHGKPGCVGKFRSLSVPALSGLKGVGGSWREKPFIKDEACMAMEGREYGKEGSNGKRRKKRKVKGEDEAGNGEVIVRPEGLPSREVAYSEFTGLDPGYTETLVLDEIRAEEYGELEEEGHVCLDYSGFGLFSHLQHDLDSSSSSFALAYVSGCLASYARYGDPDPGTIEADIRRRIMRFLNLLDQDYCMVFTSSRGSAFKLLAESFPFHPSSRFLSMYDYHSHAVSWMEEIALKHGAQVSNASFRWPSLSVCASELKAQIVHKKRRSTDGCKGLFVFPIQSRVTGSKYSYQWMSLAQENDWHVLLDASALGPKDMDSFGLSLFRPDFIVTSFYKVFGSDPTGFGCLFIKKSSINTLQQSSAARGVGMVRLVPLPGISSPNSVTVSPGYGKHKPLEIQEVGETHAARERSTRKTVGIEEPAFSAPMASVSKTEPPHLDRDGVGIKVDNTSPNDSGQSVMGNGSRRPVPSKDNSECDLKSIRETSADRKRCSCKNSQPKTDLAMLETGSAEAGIHRNHISSSVGQKKTSALSTLEQDLYRPCSKRERQTGSLSEERKVTSGRTIRPLSTCSGEQSGLTEEQRQCYDTNFELADKSSESRKGKEKMYGSKPGDASVKRREQSLTTASLHSLTFAAQKRSLLAYHSHEIRRDVGSSVGWGGLVSHDPRRDCSQAHSEGSSYCGGSQEELEFSSSLYQDDEDSSDFDVADDASVVRREPEIFCRGLNHADSLDLKKINNRLRVLMNWLITSLLKLQHLQFNRFSRLVQIYGPRLNDDRGASLAFNLFDRDGILIRPNLVQQLADRRNISLGTGFLYHIQFPTKSSGLQGLFEPEEDGTADGTLSNLGCSRDFDRSPRLWVVTIALGLVTNFEDVYRLVAFVANFLDAKFVSNELCCYQSLNQEQVVVGL